MRGDYCLNNAKNMHKYKQAAAYIAFLTIILTAGISNGYVAAEAADISQPNSQYQEAILDAFEKNDYDAWRKIVGRKSNLKDIVSRQEFEQFVAARMALRGGDYDQAIMLSEKLEKELKEKISLQIFS